MMSFESISGRIRFSPISQDDYAALAVLRVEPANRRYLRFLPETMTAEDIGKRQEKRNVDPTILDYSMHRIEDGKLVGMCTIFYINEQFKSCETGAVIATELHGSGLGTESMHAMLSVAFDEKKLHRVTFNTDMTNTPMRGWLENVAGAKHESIFRECWVNIDETYSDVAGYSILEHEWRGGIKEKLEKRIFGSRYNNQN